MSCGLVSHRTKFKTSHNQSWVGVSIGYSVPIYSVDTPWLKVKGLGRGDTNRNR